MIAVNYSFYSRANSMLSIRHSILFTSHRNALMWHLCAIMNFFKTANIEDSRWQSVGNENKVKMMK